MTPRTAPQGTPEGSVRVELKIEFSRGAPGRRRATAAPETNDAPATATEPAPTPKAIPAAPIPKITRLLVLGHHFERLVRGGGVKDFAEIARLTGMSRARVTQIVNLTLLAPGLQEEVLAFNHSADRRETIFEGDLRAAASAAAWSEQPRRWK